VPESDKPKAKRLEPPPEQVEESNKDNRPFGPDGKLRGPVERRDEVPDGEALLLEYEAGAALEPPLTYQHLAEKYDCSQSLIHRRIQQARERMTGVTIQSSRRNGFDPLTAEFNITKHIVEAFTQLRENIGQAAVERAINTVRMHMDVE
jgi:transcriptional antiterminator